MEQIVVGVDGSAVSVEAARWAADDARRRGASLVIMHAYGLGLLGRYLLGDAIGESYEEEVRREEAVELVEHIAAMVRTDHPSVNVSARVVPGRSPDALVDAAGDATLLVVGSHGTGATKALLLGSVAAALPRLSRCPVVIVPLREG